MGLMDMLTGKRTLVASQMDQPNMTAFPSQFWGMGDVTVIQRIDKPYSGEAFIEAPVGFSQPNPVFNAPAVPSPIVVGAPSTNQTNFYALQGGCN